ncbi:dTDP-4-dehydrorhamnose 3,5-epimerase family protein [Streptomyces broussonetiae]|uniref:dTDP-4-dehydrorhamnose 3,5-epimerase n=1 Tax=Streptomyces broussonetiae TaxID=2686304 RepID=A0A6I6MY41_9ACTN|nr:dTDP-4-dehydrorhamnose 3,5-epimerase family protein [Streptomyces broussonetiae]QHA03131.1 dTDP-4-dehydrorhamnose 3,5-epimerase [Streptomyces broussonetiae]
MEIKEMAIAGAFRVIPDKLRDHRGCFFEAFRTEELARATGFPFHVRQGNVSVSRRGVIRGVHGTGAGSGEAKLISCVRGAVLDVVVDLRVGSPTFGAFDTTALTEESGDLVFLVDGLGHAYQTLTEGTAISYLCAEQFVPGSQIDVNPLDPELALPWILDEEPTISDKDRAAPGLREAAAAGILPHYIGSLAVPAARAGEEKQGRHRDL